MRWLRRFVARRQLARLLRRVSRLSSHSRICALCLATLPRVAYDQHLRSAHGHTSLEVTRHGRT